MNYSKYDSSAQSTLHQSILHAKTNPLLVNNLSDAIMLEIDSVPYLVQDPESRVKRFIHFFSQHLEDITIENNEMYRPELTALRLYNCADLWYMLLYVNDMFSVSQYNKLTIKAPKSDSITMLSKFMAMVKEEEVRVVNDEANLDGKIF